MNLQGRQIYMILLAKLIFSKSEKERNKMLLLGISIVGSIIAAYSNITDKDNLCKIGLSVSMIANIILLF